MEAARVVMAFDVLNEFTSCPVCGPGATVAQRFPWERAPKRCPGGIVIAVAATAHAGHPAAGLEFLSRGLAGILNASIGVMDPGGRTGPVDQRPAERRPRPSSRQALPHRPAQDWPAVHVHDRGQKQPAFGRGEAGDSAPPTSLGRVGAARPWSRLGAMGWS